MIEYAEFSGQKAIVVFDAYNVKSSMEKIEKLSMESSSITTDKSKSVVEVVSMSESLNEIVADVNNTIRSEILNIK